MGRLFSKASPLPGMLGRPVSAWLARTLWRSFKDESWAHRARGEVLHLFFRLGLYRDIETLAVEFAAERSHLVFNSVRAFVPAEAHPEAQAQALHLVKALQQRGRLRPWNHLFGLLRLQLETAEPPSCELASAFVEHEVDSGCQMIEVRIRPSLDPLESLSLHLGSDDQASVDLLTTGETLYGERVFVVPLPKALSERREEPLRVPWRLVGRNSRDHKLDVRGSWTVSRAEFASTEFNEPILGYWQGAYKRPVVRSAGLHGRTREFEQIRRAISLGGRQSSIMVFGQRRIGKTSVLRELAGEMPPRKGELCGIFLDVSSLTLPSDAAGMAEAFFVFIVDALYSKENDAVSFLLSRSGNSESIDLRAGLKPQHNLLNAFERLAQRLSERTHGTIERLVLFVDEFDRFVEPLLVGLGNEVSTFMWNLRSVVQRAETVSLVLAGSGLQRLLTDNYKDALFGSITQISLASFSWERDREAVLDTFLPPAIRLRLCRKDEVEAVGYHAWEICGGHPMFLSLLGAAAAALGRGRHWTPAFLNYVVEQLVEVGINAEGVQVERVNFYGHIFESLLRLPKNVRELAKLLLVHLAEHTTTDFPWLETQRALSPLNLPSSATIDQCEKALKALTAEEAVTQDKATRVRVTVPITAAALRRGAPEIQREALFGLSSEDE